MGHTVMVRNTCEEKRKRDFDVKSLKDAHPTVAEFHYLGNCIRGRLVVLFCFKWSAVRKRLSWPRADRNT